MERAQLHLGIRNLNRHVVVGKLRHHVVINSVVMNYPEAS
jgi:hypothetical protein